MDQKPEPTEEDLLREEAKRIIQTPAAPIPEAAGLPDEVRNGRIEDDGHDQEQPITEPKED